MTGPLVGRGPVLAIGAVALEQARAGSGHLLLFSGEPGIGKSAVLSELARQATDRGARVLRGTCWDGGGTPAYWPWTQVLRGVSALRPDGLEGDDRAAARRLLAAPGADPAPAGEDEDADPAAARFRLLD